MFTDASEKHSSNFDALFCNWIQKRHKDFDRDDDLQADPFGVPGGESLGSEFAEQQNQNRQDPGLDGQRQIQPARLNVTANQCGRNRGRTNIREVASKKDGRQQPIRGFEPGVELLRPLVSLAGQMSDLVLIAGKDCRFGQRKESGKCKKDENREN
jgi:hypothetical protein